MYKRLIIATASAMVLAILPGLAWAQERETPTRSRAAFLGIVAESMAQEAQHEGAMVKEVTPNSPATKAGLRRGDIIIKVGDQDIRDFEELLNALSQHKPGQRVNLEVMRNGQLKQLTVTLGQRPSQQQFRGSESGRFLEEGELPSQRQFRGGETGRFLGEEERGGLGYYGRRRPTAFLGVQTEELTQDMRSRQGISAHEGVVVTEVWPNTPAQEAGVREGDVITRVDDQPISNPEELREAIQNAGPGQQVTIDVMRGKRQRELTAHLEQGTAEFGGEYGVSSMDQSREIQRLRQRISQLEQRLRRLEQSMRLEQGRPFERFEQNRPF